MHLCMHQSRLFMHLHHDDVECSFGVISVFVGGKVSNKSTERRLWFFCVAGCSIEKLCQVAITDSLTDRGSVVRAARCLLGSVTRVLLLADIVVVKQLLLAQDKVCDT